MPSGYNAPRKYDPLIDRLRELLAEQACVTLAFSDIEALIGESLPPGAWYTGFWTSGSSAKRFWHAAGFASRLLRPSTVEFRRRQT